MSGGSDRRGTRRRGHRCTDITPAESLKGIELDAAGRLWLVDPLTHRVLVLGAKPLGRG